MNKSKLIITIVAIIAVVIVVLVVCGLVFGLIGTSEVAGTFNDQQHYMAPFTGIQKQLSYSQGDEYILYYFYRQGCTNCKSFASIWQELNHIFNNMSVKPTKLSLQDIDVDTQSNSNLIRHYNVQGTLPILILKTPNENIKYTGPKNIESLYEFVKKHYTGPISTN